MAKELHYDNPDDIVLDPVCNLDFLKGAVIDKIGFHKKAKEGGLAIVYSKGGEQKTVVLGFTELGMWIYANCKTKSK